MPWFANLSDLEVVPLTIPQTLQTNLRNLVQKEYSLVHIFSFNQRISEQVSEGFVVIHCSSWVDQLCKKYFKGATVNS